MGTLYIDRKNVQLKRESRCIAVYEQGVRSGTVPLSHLERVIMFSPAGLDSTVLGALAEYGIGLTVVNSRRPERTAVLMGSSHNVAARRVGQYAANRLEAQRTNWSRVLIRYKLSAQRDLLAVLRERCPRQRRVLHKGVEQIEDRLASLDTQATRGAIRGLEGAAASAYFNGYCAVFPSSLEFNGRNRRPPRDPVNACLSLGYTLLHSDAVKACHATGLDPLIGFYHDLSFGRESLACDLVEPLRPDVDRWVWTLFRERTLRGDSFYRDKGACLLGKAGRRAFYEQWEHAAVGSRRRLRTYARVLARAFDSVANDTDVAQTVSR